MSFYRHPVRQSKNPCLVGLSGIVVHETENAFKVVTSKDQLKCMALYPEDLRASRSRMLTLGSDCAVLPKRNSVFVFSVPLYARQPTSLIASGSSSPPAPANDTVREASAPEPAASTASLTVLDMPHIEFELYGNQFCFRSADRASRKFKHKETIEL